MASKRKRNKDLPRPPSAKRERAGRKGKSSRGRATPTAEEARAVSVFDSVDAAILFLSKHAVATTGAAVASLVSSLRGEPFLVDGLVQLVREAPQCFSLQTIAAKDAGPGDVGPEDLKGDDARVLLRPPGGSKVMVTRRRRAFLAAYKARNDASPQTSGASQEGDKTEAKQGGDVNDEHNTAEAPEGACGESGVPVGEQSGQNSAVLGAGAKKSSLFVAPIPKVPTAQIRNFLEALPFYDGQIAHIDRRPVRAALYGDLHFELSGPLADALRHRGIQRLFSHQAQAINALVCPRSCSRCSAQWDGDMGAEDAKRHSAGAGGSHDDASHHKARRHLVVSTATSSGKSLIFYVPVLRALLHDPDSVSLFIFPTKALEQDQLRAINALVRESPTLQSTVVCRTYDGDTSYADRDGVRTDANVILTNPDMIHISMLPYHPKWARIFRNLRFVVMDEAHMYRGAFGTHVAMVLRRLVRLAARYGSSPQFVCCSATIANPKQHFRQLVPALPGMQDSAGDVCVVTQDGSPAGERSLVLWNPPIISPAEDSSEVVDNGAAAGSSSAEVGTQSSASVISGGCDAVSTTSSMGPGSVRPTTDSPHDARSMASTVDGGGAHSGSISGDYRPVPVRPRTDAAMASAGAARLRRDEERRSGGFMRETFVAPIIATDDGVHDTLTRPPSPVSSVGSGLGVRMVYLRRRLKAQYARVDDPLRLEAPKGPGARELAYREAMARLERAQAGEPEWRRVWLARQDANYPARRSSMFETAALLATFVRAGTRTLVFCKSRAVSELVLMYTHTLLRAVAPDLVKLVCAYRGGYVKAKRREIESKLFSGKLLGAVATNALELGVDIGSLDAVILLGYPGSVSSLWQQIGRAGRGGKNCVAVLVAFDSPVEQYFFRNPLEMMSKRPEAALLDTTNLSVLKQHMACAASESPLLAWDVEILLAGNDAITVVEQLCRDMVLERVPAPECNSPLDRLLIDRSAGGIGGAGRGAGHDIVGDHALEDSCSRWSEPGVALRLGPSTYSPWGDVQLRTTEDDVSRVLNIAANGALIDEVGPSLALLKLYEGAIYLNQGVTYEVVSHVPESKEIRVRPVTVNYFTKPRDRTDVEVISRARHSRGGVTHFGGVRVTTSVWGFMKLHKESREIVDIQDLDGVPPHVLKTVGLFCDIAPEIKDLIEARGDSFTGGCHGASHAVMNALPLFVLCDRHDLGTECPAKEATRLRPPRVLVYESSPGGVGICSAALDYSAAIFAKALSIVRDCPCTGSLGCPGCVHDLMCKEFNVVMSKTAAITLLEWSVIACEDGPRAATEAVCKAAGLPSPFSAAKSARAADPRAEPPVSSRNLADIM